MELADGGSGARLDVRLANGLGGFGAPTTSALCTTSMAGHELMKTINLRKQCLLSVPRDARLPTQGLAGRATGIQKNCPSAIYFDLKTPKSYPQNFLDFISENKQEQQDRQKVLPSQ